MSEKADTISKNLALFGLSGVETAVYLLLSLEGEKTALKISQRLKMARTRVYRILDRLVELGLVGQKLGGRGLRFVVAAGGLEVLIKKKEIELEGMKRSMAQINLQIQELTQKDKQDQSEVRYFDGAEGLVQVTWNSLQAEDELLIFELEDMSAILDYGFAEKVRQEFVKRKVRVRELTNLNRLKDWTNVTEFVEKYWQVRYLDPKQLKMSYEVLVYNSVVTMYNVRGGEPFILEIHNPHIASMQRQIFNFLWRRAGMMKRTSDRGACQLIDDE